MSKGGNGLSGRITTNTWRRATKRARRKAKKKGQDTTKRLIVTHGGKQRLVTI